MKKRRAPAKIGITLLVATLIALVTSLASPFIAFRESALCNDTVIESAIESKTGRVAILAVRQCGATAQDEVIVFVANSTDSMSDPEQLVFRGPWYDVRREHTIAWENDDRIRFSSDDEAVFLEVR